MKKKTLWLAAAIALGLPLAAVAQANPADPAAPAQALVYQSVFSDYKPWQDIKSADWRVVNETVLDAAAKGSSRGAKVAVPVAVPAPAPTAPPQATGHGGRP